MPLLAAFIVAYLIGSIPFGLILTRLTGAGDLRAIGSGNIGATNVLRTGRKGLAAATLLLDMGKGALAVWLARHVLDAPDLLSGDIEAVAGLAAVVGHCFPVWLRFRGGKGVATLLGVAFGFAGIVGLTVALVWIGVVALTRTSSLGGMAAAVALPIGGYGFDVGIKNEVPVAIVLAALVIWNHRANIARLRAGTEPKVGRRARDRA